MKGYPKKKKPIIKMNNSYALFFKIKINTKVHDDQDINNVNKSHLSPVPNAFSRLSPNSGSS